jgi:lipopolysaccharide export system protein LptA
MLRITNIFVIALFILTTAPVPPASAQSQDQPLDISAEDTLEWDRQNQTFTAKGDAVASQNDVSISADTLTAAYSENNQTGENFDIHTMTAENNVVITSQDNKAYGDKAVYELAKEYAIMTGDDLRLVTPEQTVTASEKFEYFVTEGKLIAIGNATITRPTDTLRADTLTAFLATNEKGERVLDRMTAQGNVIITTATEKLTGTYGTYNGRTKEAEITGGVTITRGPNILQGERATVDLNTQISRIFGQQSGNGRVTGTFYPDSQKKAP